MSEITPESIKRLLGMDRESSSIMKEINDAIQASQAGTIFGSRGLCDGFRLTPHPTEYFIAQEFSASGIDLRQAISKALASLGLTPIRADDFYSNGVMLCKISALIQTTPFGLYQLSTSQNRNVFIELGIAIGLGKPFILVKDRDAGIPPLLGTLEYVQIDTFLEFEDELQKKFGSNATTISRYALPEYSRERTDKQTVLIAQGGHDSLDYCITTARAVQRLGFFPVVLNDDDGKIRKYLKSENIPHFIVSDLGTNKLDETIRSINSAAFGIYQVEKTSQADTFIALGMALGLNKPILLTQKADEALPADLNGLSVISFDSYVRLSARLENELPIRLRQYGLVLPARNL